MKGWTYGWQVLVDRMTGIWELQVEIVTGYRTRTGQARGWAQMRAHVWIFQSATFKTSPKTAETVEK